MLMEAVGAGADFAATASVRAIGARPLHHLMLYAAGDVALLALRASRSVRGSSVSRLQYSDSGTLARLPGRRAYRSTS